MRLNISQKRHQEEVHIMRETTISKDIEMKISKNIGMTISKYIGMEISKDMGMIISTDIFWINNHGIEIIAIMWTINKGVVSATIKSQQISTESWLK